MYKKAANGEIFLTNNSKHITRNISKNKVIHYMNINNILTNANTEPITLRFLLKNIKKLKKNKYETTNTSRNKKLKFLKSTSKNSISSINNPKNNNKNLRLFSSTTNNQKLSQKAYSNLINKTYLINTHFKSTVKTKNLFYSITSPTKNFNDKVKQIDFMKNINKRNIINYKTKEFSNDLISLNTKESTFNNKKNYGYKNSEFFQKYDNLRLRANNLLNNYVDLIEIMNKNLRKIKNSSISNYSLKNNYI